jgi:acyl carrier protein
MQSVGFDEFLNVFREQFAPEVQPLIHARSAFRQLEGWSSLQALIIVTAMDEAFQVLVTEEDLRLAVTIEDLYNRLKQRSS